MNLRANVLNLFEWTASYGINFNQWRLPSEAFWPKDRISITEWDFSPQAGISLLLKSFTAPTSPVLTYQNLFAKVSILQVEIGSIFHKGGSQTTYIFWSAPHGRLSNSTNQQFAPQSKFCNPYSQSNHDCPHYWLSQILLLSKPLLTYWKYLATLTDFTKKIDLNSVFMPFLWSSYQFRQSEFAFTDYGGFLLLDGCHIFAWLTHHWIGWLSPHFRSVVDSFSWYFPDCCFGTSAFAQEVQTPIPDWVSFLCSVPPSLYVSYPHHFLLLFTRDEWTWRMDPC